MSIDPASIYSKIQSSGAEIDIGFFPSNVSLAAHSTPFQFRSLFRSIFRSLFFPLFFFTCVCTLITGNHRGRDTVKWIEVQGRSWDGNPVGSDRGGLRSVTLTSSFSSRGIDAMSRGIAASHAYAIARNYAEIDTAGSIDGMRIRTRVRATKFSSSRVSTGNNNFREGQRATSSSPRASSPDLVRGIAGFSDSDTLKMRMASPFCGEEQSFAQPIVRFYHR